ncbi:MAG: 1,3-beta-galactosyl-N-acetylhexosamine phosphorylase N-terminal domain-containing protein [Blautia wexlerae]
MISHRWWEVIDRTTGEVVPVESVDHMMKKAGNVVITSAKAVS